MAAAGTQSTGGRILLTGATGQVGKELQRSLVSLGKIVAPTRREADLSDVASDFRSLRETIRAVQPRWIVNSAAYTDVDGAENERDLAYAINRDAVRVMGEEAKEIGAVVVHFSTDYVFDGAGSTAYVESDVTGPVNVYGTSKLAGELALAESGSAYFIFRTSWVYGGSRKNFLRTILKLAREREVVRVVADQHGAPTWSKDLAAMTKAVMGCCEAESGPLRDVVKRMGGIFHAAGAGVTTWYGFAAEAVRLEREFEPGAGLAEIEPVTTAEYPTTARRPSNSQLNCDKLAERFGWRMMDWQESLRKVLSEL